MLSNLFKEKTAKLKECAILGTKKKIPPIFALFKDNIINVLIHLSGKMAISLFSVQLTNLSGSIYPHH